MVILDVVVSKSYSLYVQITNSLLIYLIVLIQVSQYLTKWIKQDIFGLISGFVDRQL